MSSTVTVHPTKGVRGIGMITVIAGIVMIVLGLGVWVVVSQTLSDEQITVSDDSTFMNGTFAGQHVAGPLTAYAQADVIDMHATEMAGGKTYAELPQDDPVRESVMDASFLRASLFTSVVAFGVCALVIGLGIVFILLGSALRKLAGGPQVVVDTPALSSGGDLSHAAHRAEPAEPARPAPGKPEPTTPEPTRPARTEAPAPPPERPSTRTAPEAPAGGTPPPTSTTPPSTTPPSAPPAAPSTPPENPPATPPSSGSGSPSA
ncbi:MULTISPECIES: hypothetical protein [unclassified Isoptericola]|uniref:hypothetical protein n=1 Tax=unclassified Isoptericola TaxID=2623355 RepID=UPI00365224DA